MADQYEGIINSNDACRLAAYLPVDKAPGFRCFSGVCAVRPVCVT